jgi:hypothetical protein
VTATEPFVTVVPLSPRSRTTSSPCSPSAAANSTSRRETRTISLSSGASPNGVVDAMT